MKIAQKSGSWKLTAARSMRVSEGYERSRQVTIARRLLLRGRAHFRGTAFRSRLRARGAASDSQTEKRLDRPPPHGYLD